MTEQLKFIWNSFFSFYSLNETQQNQFHKYLELLTEWNEMHNITSITDPHSIILDHFWDSLSISKATDLNKINSIADVGSGGGFPIVPIKIVYPHIKIYPIEVNQKKVAFLEFLAEKLDLRDVFISDIDWRTFLRKSEFKIEIFTARASLPIDELLRVFKPSSFYKESELIYWASKSWEPKAGQEKFISNEFDYKVGDKSRKLVFFKDI